jgi:hypothetical protein
VEVELNAVVRSVKGKVGCCARFLCIVTAS